MRAFFPVAVNNVVDGTFVVLLEDIGIEYVLAYEFLVCYRRFRNTCRFQRILVP